MFRLTKMHEMNEVIDNCFSKVSTVTCGESERASCKSQYALENCNKSVNVWLIVGLPLLLIGVIYIIVATYLPVALVEGDLYILCALALAGVVLSLIGLVKKFLIRKG